MSSGPVLTWREVVSLKPRFTRSVHIERDAKEDGWLEGYVLGPAAREVLHRIAAGAASESRARAWSLTGPYGTGKSSLVLFASHGLGVAGEAALDAVAAADADLAERLRSVRGLVPVRATGERRKLAAVLLTALKRSVEDFFSGPGAKPAALYEDLQSALEQAEAGESVATSRVVRVFEAAAAKVAASNRQGRGLFVVLDEAGKVLEHAAQHPDEGDLQLFQELAEAAARSGERTLVFVVVLHQGFDQYASRLTVAQRNEWAKVQGRFEDLPFQEAEDQVVQLISHALRSNGMPRGWADRIHELAEQTVRLIPRLPAPRARMLADALAATAPLHPLTALVLGPIFRGGFGQNERSLFAFLTSSEPRGFQEYLDTSLKPGQAGGLYAPDRFYDYLRAITGFRFQGGIGRQWSHAESALARLPADSTELDARVVKVVAVLAVAGDAIGLRPSRFVVRLALAGGAVTAADVDRSVDQLVRRSILVYRKYRDAYQLWDGSDIDLDALIQAGLTQSIAAGGNIRRLTRISPPRPLIPRRHALRTGTLRYFEVRYADEQVLDGTLESSSEADGTLYVLIPSDDTVESEVRRRLGQPMFWLGITASAHERPVLTALPRNGARLRQLASELAAMEWVQTHTAELRDDPTARRELAERIAAAEVRLREEIDSVYEGTDVEWYASHKPFSVVSARELSKRLSGELDKSYARAPWISSEVINRNDLSSAGAAARRDLLQAMIERAGQPRLGMEGFPPEYAILRAVLCEHGIYDEATPGARFRAPASDEAGSLRPAWEEVLRLLSGPERSRVSMTAIIAHLKRPPFGMREGVILILLVAILLERASEIALYEEGTFVSGLTAAVAERILRSAKRFELQRVRLAGSRAAILRKLSGVTTDAEVELVPLARQLVRLATGLPEHARNTRRLSPTALAVREALLRAKEPGPLLFHMLPEACGIDAISADTVTDEAAIDLFVARLKIALRELRSALPNLLAQLVTNIGTSFGMPTEVRALRAVLGPRAQRLLSAPTDATLRAFLIRTGDRELDDEAWMVSVATLLGGKPPETWQDNDIDLAALKLAGLKKAFRTVEALHVALLSSPLPDDGLVLRVAVAEPGREESEGVLVTPPESVHAVRDAASALLRASAALAPGLTRDQIVAAMALCIRDLLCDAPVEATDSLVSKDLPS